jgi:hypothetical protein
MGVIMKNTPAPLIKYIKNKLTVEMGNVSEITINECQARCCEFNKSNANLKIKLLIDPVNGSIWYVDSECAEGIGPVHPVSRGKYLCMDFQDDLPDEIKTIITAPSDDYFVYKDLTSSQVKLISLLCIPYSRADKILRTMKLMFMSLFPCLIYFCADLLMLLFYVINSPLSYGFIIVSLLLFYIFMKRELAWTVYRRSQNLSPLEKTLTLMIPLFYMGLVLAWLLCFSNTSIIVLTTYTSTLFMIGGIGFLGVPLGVFALVGLIYLMAKVSVILHTRIRCNNIEKYGLVESNEDSINQIQHLANDELKVFAEEVLDRYKARSIKRYSTVIKCVSLGLFKDHQSRSSKQLEKTFKSYIKGSISKGELTKQTSEYLENTKNFGKALYSDIATVLR